MKALIPATVFTLMFGLGLGLRPEALAALRHRPGLAARLLLGSCALVPLAALLLLQLPVSDGIPPGLRLAILVMALCPSAPLTLRRAGVQGGDRELAAGLQLLAAAASVITIPLLVQLFQAVLRARGWSIPATLVAAQVLALQGLPLGLGLAVRHRWPEFAGRWSGPIERFGFLLLLVLVTVILLRIGPQLLPFLAANGVALGLMALLTLGSLALGALLSGPGRPERISGAVLTSLRNPGLALLFATLFAAGIYGVHLGIVIYQLITLLVSGLVFRIWRGVTEA